MSSLASFILGPDDLMGILTARNDWSMFAITNIVSCAAKMPNMRRSVRLSVDFLKATEKTTSRFSCSASLFSDLLTWLTGIVPPHDANHADERHEVTNYALALSERIKSGEIYPNSLSLCGILSAAGGMTAVICEMIQNAGDRFDATSVVHHQAILSWCEAVPSLLSSCKDKDDEAMMSAHSFKRCANIIHSTELEAEPARIMSSCIQALC
eukprot:TRINITY_DN6637_c0_g1_i1.p2 TRINITY_DN6637_c0_g1~~TRINITY_DN6637_c0_g1_i1.p2  ORF type:complete len:211 (-),score=35.32 TRINITY_DN6637_c0_g1_i1:1461-2093(-)